MNEEKNNNLEPEITEEAVTEEVAETVETAEVVEEAVEEAVAEEAVEEVVAEEAVEAEDVEEISEEVLAEVDGELVEDAEEEEIKKTSKGVIAAVAAVVVALVAIAVLASNYFGLFGDKYSKMYVDVTGTTAGEVANQLGMEFEDFVEYYNLPDDVTVNSHEYAIINVMPAGTYIEKVLGTNFETAHEFFDWDDSITEDTPIGEAWNKTPLTKYYGEAYIEEVKTMYGLGEDVTGETLYGDVRKQIEQAMLEQRLEEEAAAAETESATEAADDAEEEAEETEAVEEEATEAAAE